jgi:NADH-quinone oxidoreductase subunit E/NADP-reducing hydrogenase subunit HndA
MAQQDIRVIPPDEAHAIFERYKAIDPMEAMIPALQELQTQYGFITEAVANQMAEELDLSISEIYGVITFYSFFRFSPRGGRVLLTCEGTSCYVRGAGPIRGAIEDRLNVGPGQTSADGRITFEPSSVCIGACDLGPMAEAEGRYYTHLTPEKINQVIDELLAMEGEVGHGHGPADHAMGPYGFGPTAQDLGSALDTPNPDPSGPHRSGLLPKGLT